MQHPDEGQIHAWLDGALTRDEAVSLEAHVADCAECATKVAEARGLVAGASRILNTLDNVPRVAAPAPVRRPYNSRFLQAAALFIVVAGGGALIARTRSNDATLHTASVKSVAPDTIEETVILPAGPVAAPAAPAERRVASKTSARPRDPQIVTTGVAGGAARDASVSSPALMAKAETANFDAVTEAPPAQMAAPAPSAPLTVLKTEWSAQETRTFFQVAPNRVAILIEPSGPEPRGLVAGAVAQATSAMMRSGTAAGSVGGTANLAPQPIAPTDTLRWKDSVGKSMMLVGPFSAAELADLKQRILAIHMK